MRALIATGLIAIALPGSTMPAASRRGPDPFAEATPLCTVMSNPAAYVGKRVVVRGYLTSSPHGREFRGEGCRSLPVHPAAFTRKSLRLLQWADYYRDKSPGRPPRAVYSGILTDHSPALICDAGLCSNFTLEAAEIEAVRPG